MASKKYIGKTCVYCATAVSETADHVFSRSFFAEKWRHGIPKVPACHDCNTAKSALEHYLASVLPFGSEHEAALSGQTEELKRRLDHNEPLRTDLAAGIGDIQVADASGRTQRMLGLPFRGREYTRYMGMALRGLVWHEWRTIVPPTYVVEAWTMGPDAFMLFQQDLLAPGKDHGVRRSYANGALVYSGTAASDDRAMSTWHVSLYGDIGIVGTDDHGQNLKLTTVGVTLPGRLKHVVDKWLGRSSAE